MMQAIQQNRYRVTRLVTCVFVLAVVAVMFATSGAPAFAVPATQLDASGFDFVTNMTTDPKLEDLEPNGTNDWYDFSGATALGTGSGGESVLVLDGGDDILASGVVATSGSSGELWPNNGFGNTLGYTWEVRAKIISQTGTGGAMGITGYNSDTAELINLIIKTAGQEVESHGSVGGGTYDNTDGFHDFRVAVEPGVGIWVWRDQELLTPTAISVSTGYPRDAFIIGPGISGSYEGTTEVDYIALHEGAVSPVPEPSALVLVGVGLIGLLGCTRRRRPTRS